MIMFVQCPECGERHYNTEIQVDDVEEGPQGEDIVTYTCPVTGQETKATVYAKR